VTQTLVSLWTDVRRRLEAAGIDTPVFDARLLLEAGAGVTRLEQVSAVEALTRRREQREPAGHILGRRHFWTLDLAVSPDVLIPRPETELLVEFALKTLAPQQEARVLDLGVGSGAILLATLTDRPNATGVGVDRSEEALAVAQANANALNLSSRLDLRKGDWAEDLNETFDLVLSNPPYIASNDIDGLAPEVALYEPRMALDGGADGYDAYRAIIAELPRLLKPGGVFAFEVGQGQADTVAGMAEAQGLTTMPIKRDLADIPRVVAGQRAA
jgi:release factor glutamine methyltransferase